MSWKLRFPNGSAARETDFRGRAFPNGVWERVGGLIPVGAAGRARTGGRGRLAAVDPRAREPLVLRRFQRTAAVAALPADDLARPATVLAALLPAPRPAAVGRGGAATFLVPEEALAGAVALHTHCDGREGGRPQLRRAQRLAVAVADALQEVGPQGRRPLALAD